MPDKSEEQISDLVDTFYTKVRADSLIGPIFDEAIGDGWDEHLVKIKSFWASVMLGARSYKGNPMMTHLNLPKLSRGHFDRWLDLWRETAAEICEEDIAALFVQKAEMIAERFLHAIILYWDAVHQPAASQTA